MAEESCTKHIQGSFSRAVYTDFRKEESFMLIIHAHLFPMDQDPIPDGFLAWENGVITSIGPMKLCPPMLENTIDLKGASLMPGLIDAHCHIGICGDGGGIENEDINEETDPVTPHLRAIDAVNPFDRCFEEAVAAGVTTVLTGPGSANPIAGEFCALKTWGETIEDRIIAAPVGMKFSLGENPKMTYSGKNQTPITRMATAALIREQLMKARRYQKDKARAAEDDELDEPELDLKCEALIPALNRKIKAFFHAHRADDILTAIRISEEFGLDPVIVHGTEGYRIASTLSKKKIPVITGPIMGDRSKPELLYHTTANTALLRQHGVPTAICTDHPETPIQYLALTAALCQKAGLSREDALLSLTRWAAELSGVSSRAGTLTPGKDADLVIFQGDPFDIMNSPQCVLINGEVRFGRLNV